MQRFSDEPSGRIWGPIAAAAVAIMATVASASCTFDLPNRCEQFGVHCQEGQECASSQIVCIDIGGCGNGIVDQGEICDDGNIVDGDIDETGALVLDSCNRDCTSTQECGNGIKDTGEDSALGEQCDDGNNLACGTCNATCSALASARATGQIIAVRPDAIIDGGTFTLNDGFTPPKTFEFDFDDSFNPANIRINLMFIPNSASTVAGLVGDAIGATSLLIAASTSGAIVNLRHDRFTSVGNLPIVETIVDPGFSVIGMSGGAGGDCAVNVRCEANEDCLSGFCAAPMATLPKVCQ